jgi:hypothetical protein
VIVIMLSVLELDKFLPQYSIFYILHLIDDYKPFQKYQRITLAITVLTEVSNNFIVLKNNIQDF